ncbi:MAG TPA: hypothetical protein VM577_19745 [Anaerovoracaceae bacterium]|nr:hypothetical protein [Anaerovoracaceae bacterium]
MLSEGLYNLRDFFIGNPKVALCFTGGVNSTYLLYVGKQCGANIKAYYVKTALQPQFELDNALCLAKKFHASLTVLEADFLSDDIIVENQLDRCYYCKNKLLSIIKKQAEKDGPRVVVEGSNASDKSGRCLEILGVPELQVHSPLKEFGITKTKVRMLSKKAGLLTWDKPVYSCLAAHIPS